MDTSVGIDDQEELRLRLRLQAIVARAATARSGELDALLDRCAAVIATALRADSLGIWVVADGPGELQLTARATRPGEPQPEPMPRVTIAPEHVSAMSTAAHPALFRNPRLGSPLFAGPLEGPERQATVAPLLVDGDRLIGLLAMLHAEPLTPGTEETFASLADPLALVVEKERAVERLHEREEGLGTMIRTAPDGMVMMDAESTILGTNPSLDRIFGYEPGELVGQKITALMPDRFRARHDSGVRRYSQTGTRRVQWTGLELVGLRKDGSEFPIEVSFGEYHRDGTRVFTGFIRDISERKRLEAHEKRKRRVIQATAVYIGSAVVALQALDVLLPVLPLPAWTFKALVAAASAGLPLAAAAAWRHEPGAAGSAAAHAPTRPYPAWGRWSGAATRIAGPAIAVLGLTALFAAGFALAEPLGRAGSRGGPAVVALPFAVIGSVPEDAILAAGLTEDVVTELSRRPDFRVPGRASVEAALLGGRSGPAIARELGATHVLEGSVRRVEGRVRITARLVRAGSEQPVWSETFDRDLRDAFVLQTDVARAIVAGVGDALPPQQRKSIQSFTRGGDHGQP
jgi:PAS domain S-box-containing protein